MPGLCRDTGYRSDRAQGAEAESRPAKGFVLVLWLAAKLEHLAPNLGERSKELREGLLEKNDTQVDACGTTREESDQRRLGGEHRRGARGQRSGYWQP